MPNMRHAINLLDFFIIHNRFVSFLRFPLNPRLLGLPLPPRGVICALAGLHHLLATNIIRKSIEILHIKVLLPEFNISAGN